jgi:hypothetical protein
MPGNISQEEHTRRLQECEDASRRHCLQQERRRGIQGMLVWGSMAIVSAILWRQLASPRHKRNLLAIANAVVAGANGLVWVGLAWLGWGVLKAAEAQHIAGYPTRPQFGYHLGFPLVMAACAVGLYIVARYPRFRAPALLAQALVLFVPLLLGYIGSV